MAVCYQVDVNNEFIRPPWPYESWISQDESNDGEESKISDPSSSDTKDDNADDTDRAPKHDVDFGDDVTDSNQLKVLIGCLDSHNVADTDEAKQINEVMKSMIDKTIQSLSSKHEVFKNCYMKPIGSVTENSKVLKPDEFDYAIILPSLADDDVFDLLRRKYPAKFDQTLLDLLPDSECISAVDFFSDFSYGLKRVWAKEMHMHVANGWEILESVCCLDDVSVAGTYHLKRISDGDIVDVDICFWIPLNAARLTSAPKDVEQALYLSKYCLDQDENVYAILPRDAGIDFAINCVRFPMSSLEKETFQNYGHDNNRIKCYRICKCIVHRFVPMFRKREGCDFCFESIISSFAIKNVILYLINAYESDDMWADGQLVNRVVEVFSILCLCMKVNGWSISAYFCPYVIKIDNSFRYNPKENFIYMQTDSNEGDDIAQVYCKIPNVDDILDATDDKASHDALLQYRHFLRDSSWSAPEVVCRLYELLSVLREEDKGAREVLVEDVGWSLFGLG